MSLRNQEVIGMAFQAFSRASNLFCFLRFGFAILSLPPRVFDAKKTSFGIAPLERQNYVKAMGTLRKGFPNNFMIIGRDEKKVLPPSSPVYFRM